MPKLITFIQNPIQIDSFKKAGADAFILDHSDLSIRSFTQTKTPLSEWLSLIKEKSQDIPLWLNCDGLIHEHNFKKMETLITCLKEHAINHIRIQDLGLIPFFKEKMKNVSLSFCQEFGNQNSLTLQSLSKTCDIQLFNHETPFHIIQQCQKKVSSKWEIQVFGPILIQYSKRRFLANLNQTQSWQRYLAADQDYPKRWYTFLDNPHGHFMYLYFEKSLLDQIETLKQLNIDHWLIDGRGYDDDYTISALKLFKKKQDKKENNTTEDLEIFKKWHQKPFKPAFFLSNRTDQTFKERILLPEKTISLGIVKDVIKNQCIAITCHHDLNLNNTLLFITSKNEIIKGKVIQLKDIHLKEKNKIKKDHIALINYIPKIQPKSTVFLEK